MSLKTVRIVVALLCLLTLSRIPTHGQLMTQTPFKYAQLGFLDSAAGESVATGFHYPAVLLAMKSTAVLSIGKMLEVPNWNQIDGCFFSRKKSTGFGIQFSVEKLMASTQSRAGFQVTQLLQNECAIGVVLGVSSVAIGGYKKELKPFSKLGLQTKLSDKLTASFTLTLESHSGFLVQKSKSIYATLLAGTQLHISSKVAAILHLQKAANSPMEWMGLLRYLPAVKFRFQLGFSPDPQWWMLHASFMLQQFTMQIGLGIHPLVGALSRLSFQIPTLIK